MPSDFWTIRGAPAGRSWSSTGMVGAMVSGSNTVTSACQPSCNRPRPSRPKNAATFQVIDGQRYSIPGDWAEVLADGTVKLLGRGSQCINTGGEKVYPEEVEECLKLHPAVLDAAVVGLPDERFGEAINAVVEPAPGAVIDADDLIEHVKARLARYKAPKAVHVVDSIGRAVNGKLDYKRVKALAQARVSGA